MSLWNIDDNATKDLMLEFMRGLKRGEATEFVLREAMLAMRQRYADPALWAGLFGLPAKAARQPERVASRVALPRELPTPRVMTVPHGPAQRAVLYEIHKMPWRGNSQVRLCGARR
jgi:hypothetical protein